MTITRLTALRLASFWVFVLLSFFGAAHTLLAASLQATPGTGVYQLGSTFTVRVTVSSDGQAVNAAEGTLKFNPAELQVVSVNRNSSVFNLWVTEPTFSNSAGTVTFSGGSPAGYTGTAGTVFTVTFKSLTAGTSRISFTTGAVLANDGRGTNVLSAMNGGTYTIQAAANQPTPEVIEYVAPANTPAAPKITSTTHPDPAAWSTKKTAVLEWTLPSDVVAIRTLLDGNRTSVPTKVYDEPTRTITLNDLPEGESYFHLQFQNDDGWGKVAHYRLAVDTVKPESITVSLPEGADMASPIQTLIVASVDATSPVTRYMIRIDDSEAFSYLDETASGTVVLPQLEPGYHSVIIEAFDAAGNGQIGTFSFTISAFEKPTFTEYPTEMSAGVIPVIRGTTRPGAEVTVSLAQVGSDAVSYSVVANTEGVFTVIPEGRLTEGVYELIAIATDVNGAVSAPSDTIRIAVQRPGYLQVGSFLVSVLSVVVPLIALVVVLVLLASSLLLYTRRFRRNVSRESKEAVAILVREFETLDARLKAEEERLVAAKRTKKLSELEQDVFDSLHRSLGESRERVKKEIEDVETLVHTDT